MNYTGSSADSNLKLKWLLMDLGTDVLDEMINCLTLMDEDNIYEVIGFGGEWDFIDMTIDDYNKMNQIRDENKTRFFKLFGKYFYNLWD